MPLRNTIDGEQVVPTLVTVDCMEGLVKEREAICRNIAGQVQNCLECGERQKEEPRCEFSFEEHGEAMRLHLCDLEITNQAL